MTLSILLQALVAPDDSRALFAALRSPALAVSDDDLVPRFLDSAPQGLSPAAIDAETRLRALAEDARKLSPADFLEHLAEQLALFPAFGFRPDGALRIENLRLVIEAAAPLAEAGFDSLPDFVRWLTERRADDPLGLGEIEPAGGDVVSILTIHKAKGLEFPVVVIADLGARPSTPPPWVTDRTMGTLEFRAGIHAVATPGFDAAKEREKARRSAEDLRLLYVAATRARDHLVLSWPEGDRGYLAGDMLPSRLHAVPGQPPPADAELGVLRAETLPAAGAIASVHVVAIDGAVRAARAAAGPGDLFPDTHGETEQRVTHGRILPVTVFTQVDRATSHRVKSEDFDDDLKSLPGIVFGTLVHAALEAWTDRADFEGTLTDAVDAALRRVAEPVGPEARDHFEAELRRIARDPVVAEILSAKGSPGRRVLREVPFLLPLDEDLLSGTVDVILEREDGSLVIVDYKTDQLATDDPAAAAARHHRQAALYAWAVARLTRREVVEVRLLFLATDPVTVRAFPGGEELSAAARAVLDDPELRLRARAGAGRAHPEAMSASAIC